SGTVEGVTREPGGEVRSAGALSTTQARLTVDGPLGDRGIGFVASARAGLHDALSPDDQTSYLAGGVADWLGRLVAPAFGGQARALAYGIPMRSAPRPWPRRSRRSRRAINSIGRGSPMASSGAAI